MTGVRAVPAAFLVALLATGCATPLAPAAARAARVAADRERSLPAPSPAGTEVPGLVHVHTRFSHDSPGPLDEVLAAARRTGVGWIALTEHSTPRSATDLPRGRVDGVLLVPGEELSRFGGSVLAVGVERSVPPGGRRLGPVVDDVHADGGLALWGHYGEFTFTPPDGADGMAVYDLSGEIRAMGPLDFPAFLFDLRSADPDEAAAGFVARVLERPAAHLAAWDRFLARGRMTAVAETNAHAKFRWFGTVFDPYVALFGLVRNHAWLRGDDTDAVVEALRAGRVFVAFDAVADATGARCELWRAGRFLAATGDERPFAPGLTIGVHLPVPGTVRLLHDGRVVRTRRGRVHRFPVTAPGAWRVEVDREVGGTSRPWILFNAFRLVD